MPRPRLFRTVALALLAVVIHLHAAYLGVVGILSIRYRAHNPSRTALMTYRTRTDGAAPSPTYLPLSGVPATLVRSVIYIEDYGFFRHRGTAGSISIPSATPWS